jgi:leucyl-tRNA synthetase
VLGTVGTGAVVGVPAHDIRDFEFAQQFRLETARVVVGPDGDESEVKSKEQVQEEEGKMINSGFLDGMEIKDAIPAMMEHLEKEGWGKKTVRYHLRDWIFSRQHYWGEPIPMIYCEKDGWIPVEEKDLPVVLPEVEHYEPTDSGESPLAKMEDWVNVECPKCGGKARRETDTMPNWAGSDWYFVRYIDPDNKKALADMDKMKYWLPVDVYFGGDEHNTLHLLYSRFIYQFLYDLGHVPTPEPYYKRISHGVILGVDGKRMSKSRGNVIVPDDVVEKVGADATRAYLMFMGPFEATMAWSDSSLMGVKRFVARTHKFVTSNIGKWGNEDSPEVVSAFSKAIRYITDSTMGCQFNTVIARFMELLNLFERVGPGSVSQETLEKYLTLMSPYMPFITEELWAILGNEKSIHLQEWPKYEKSSQIEENMEIPIQINGKVRERVQITPNLGESEVRGLTLSNSKIKELIGTKEVKKFIYVPNRTVNIVI